MSGGRFDYDQYKLQSLSEDIQEIIERNNPLNPGDRHSPEIIARYKEAAYNLERTYQMVQRIDWLESQDDGPESFMERWDAEVPPTWEETFKTKQSPEPKYNEAVEKRISETNWDAVIEIINKANL